MFKGFERRILKHKAKGDYYSVERYLNTLFNIVREDCYKDLRRTFYYISKNKNFLKEKQLKIEKKFIDVYIYNSAKLSNYVISDKCGIIIDLEFKSYYKKINFKKRMKYGSLLIITNENLDDYILATVFKNPYDKQENTMEEESYKIRLSLLEINL